MCCYDEVMAKKSCKHKFDSAAAYFNWMDEHGLFRAGTEVEREDGNTYIVTRDGMSLKTPDGVYVCPIFLDPYNDQEFASLTCNAELTLEDIDPDKTEFPGMWEYYENQGAANEKALAEQLERLAQEQRMARK